MNSSKVFLYDLCFSLLPFLSAFVRVAILWFVIAVTSKASAVVSLINFELPVGKCQEAAVCSRVNVGPIQSWMPKLQRKLFVVCCNTAWKEMIVTWVDDPWTRDDVYLRIRCCLSSLNNARPRLNSTSAFLSPKLVSFQSSEFVLRQSLDLDRSLLGLWPS